MLWDDSEMQTTDIKSNIHGQDVVTFTYKENFYTSLVFCK
jgi:hypothetical protein